MLEEVLGLEVRLAGDDCPLADASRAAHVPLEVEPPQLRADGYALLRFTGPTDDRLVAALDGDDRLRYLHGARAGDRTRFRCLSKQACVVHELISAGLLVERIRYQSGDARVVGEVVGREVLQGVLHAASETVGATLERVYPLSSSSPTAIEQRWDLTPAQAEALQTAHAAGYFSVPREVTAGEVADQLGISKSAFLERLRRGQDALFDRVF